MGGIIKTATGATATFSTQLAIPMRSVQVAFSPVQGGSGDPSPTNIRPITGWTGLNVYHAGKNLFNGTMYSGRMGSDGVFSNTDGYQTRRICNANATQCETQWFIPGTYTISATNLASVSVLTKDASFNIIDNFAYNWHAMPYTFTLTAPGYLYFTINNNNADISPTGQQIQIEVGSTATTYEAYIATTTISVEFGEDVGTVYGGTVDLTTGVLTEEYVRWDSAKIAEKITQNSSSLYARGVRFGSNKIVNSATVYANKLKPMKAGNWGTVFTSGDSGSLYTDANYIGIVMDDTGNTTKAEWATWVQNLGLEFVVKQQTPVTYQLTPQQVNALAGLNNVWSNANGDTTVEYLERGVNPLALRRWVLMGQKPASDWHDLYQQVTYLASTGTQYINTGILLEQDDKVTIKFNVSTISSTQTKVIWGYRWAGTYADTSQSFMQETSTFRAIAAGVPSTAQGVGNEACFSFDTINTVVIDSANDSITVNGVTPTGLHYDLSNGKAFDSTGSSVYSPCLFTFNVLGTPNTSVIPSNLSVYEYIVERNGAEIQHFLPCYRKADDKPGMYDTVSGTFYTNAGTGEFVVGETVDIVPFDQMAIVQEPTTKGEGVAKTVLGDGKIIKNVNSSSDSFYGSGMTTTVSIENNTVHYQTSNANYGIAICLELSPSTNYTYTFNIDNNSSYSSTRAMFYDASQTYISYGAAGGGDFTTPANTKYVVFTFRSNFVDMAPATHILYDFNVTKRW